MTPSLILLAGVLVFDRVEPPMAVLIDQEGQRLDVPLVRLPADATPGDALESPEGPILPGRPERRRQLAAQLARLTRLSNSGSLAMVSAVGQGPQVARRRSDHYARRARREGFAARSVYKLDEIDRRVRLLAKGDAVLDLGSSPGSWLQYIARAVGSGGRVLGIDLQAVSVSLPKHVEVLQGDAFDLDPEALGGSFDVVTSDMAPRTTGNRTTDHARSIDLCRQALAVALRVLRPGGRFVCKAFAGEDLEDLVSEVRGRIRTVRRIRPRGTRSESTEVFVVGLGFDGQGGGAEPDEANVENQ